MGSERKIPGRWDDAEGNFGTVNTGSSLLACLLEVLADFRNDAQVAAALTEV